jgi:hypothetical protein
MKNNISIHNFRFEFLVRGHYNVTYTSPVTYKSWARVVNDMPLVDGTKNSECPKIKDLNKLKKYVKS